MVREPSHPGNATIETKPPRSGSPSLVSLVAACAAWFGFFAPTGAVFGQEAETDPGNAPAPAATSKPGAEPPRDNPGRVFLVAEPVTSRSLQDLESAAQSYLESASGGAARPTLIFEFSSRGVEPGQTRLGAARDLVDLLTRRLAAARFRVAYVNEPLRGYAVLGALACDEIVMGPVGSLGPIAPPGESLSADEIAFLSRTVSQGGGIDENLVRGMFQPDRPLSRVVTADGSTRFVFQDDLEAFRAANEVSDARNAWEATTPGVITAAMAREWNVARRLVNDIADLKGLYRLEGRAFLRDPTAGQPLRPTWIQVRGPINTMSADNLRRQINRAADAGSNVLIFEINSPGGMIMPASSLADAIAHLENVKTVAYVAGETANAATLLALACDEIFVRSDSRIGDVRYHQTRRNGSSIELDAELRANVTNLARDLAATKRHNPALAAALVDPEVVIAMARDKETGAVQPMIEEEAKENPGRFDIVETRKPAGRFLSMDAREAAGLGLATATVEGDRDLRQRLGLEDVKIARVAPNWVDSLVTFLNTPVMSGFLLFLGIFMFIVELKLPGVGLPAIISALAFILFFWSHYLGGTASELEILLFVLGLICLGLEVLVFPGVGVFGISALILLIGSVIMASHTFDLPRTASEHRAMVRTLLSLMGSVVGVVVGSALLLKFLPRIPYVNKVILTPEIFPDDDEIGAKPSLNSDPALLALIGETGRSTTVLRPSGKARFGDMLVDVTTEGAFVEANRPVEVVEVKGNRVVVKRVQSHA